MNKYIFIIDDSPIIGYGLKAFFKDSDYKVQTFIDEEKFLERIKKFDLKNTKSACFLDLNLKKMHAEELYEKMVLYKPSLKVIAVSVEQNIYRIKKLLQKGWNGFIHKGTNLAEYKRAINVVNSNGTYIDNDTLEILAKSFCIPSINIRKLIQKDSLFYNSLIQASMLDK